MPTTVRLTSLRDETGFAPLGVLGYCLTRTQFLTPVWAELKLPLKAVGHAPEAKLLDIVISILAGCRAISQVNTRLRPDAVQARAWGRPCFADQSTLARTLDAFETIHVTQLRHGSEAFLRRHSRAYGHPFDRDWLWLDIDLTPLPISKHAEASTKGKMEKKTATGVNWPGCMRRNIMRPCSRACIPASKTAVRPTSRYSTHWKSVSASRRLRNNAPSCGPMPALEATPT